jgi:allophanate hydrolase
MNADAAVSSNTGWTITEWQQAYRAHGAQPADLLGRLLAGLAGDNAWICLADEARLAAQLKTLAGRLAAADGDTARLPLYGVPFAIKDNIDAAGWPTTAACPEFAYVAEADATVVRRLREAGAILIGKTNLDQFATGLVGTRSPHGAVPNTFDPAYISGGSSSGSASVLARGLVAFSLGTDTAGSGRVPAGFNNIVGLKPTKGWLSNQGVVPACKTLDCVSIFALTVADADLVATIAGGYDRQDPYSRPAPAAMDNSFSPRPRLAVPKPLEFFGDTQAEQAFHAALQKLRDQGAAIEFIDYTPFAELAALLYQGPWVAERFVAVQALWERKPEAINPVVRGIVEQAANYSACDTFKAEYKRAELTRRVRESLAGYDAMVVPTSPSIYTIAQLEAEPVVLNSRLGVYTNFVNFADLAALALPALMRADGLPAGITLIGAAWSDHALAEFGRRWQAALALPLGATGRALPAPVSPTDAKPSAAKENNVLLAVVGAHLRGMPLNHQLTSRGARFVEETRSADVYQLYALANTTPPKPGLRRAASGASIVLEVWELSFTAFGEFVAEVPAPMGIGTVTLADGRQLKGFICEPSGLDGAQDITAFGGWRAFLDSRKAATHQ